MCIVEKGGGVEIVDGVPCYLVVGEGRGGGGCAVVHLARGGRGECEGASEDVGGGGGGAVHTVVPRVGTRDVETGGGNELARGRGLVVEECEAALVVNVIEAEDAGEGVGCDGGGGVTVVGLVRGGDVAGDIERRDGAEVLGDESIAVVVAGVAVGDETLRGERLEGADHFVGEGLEEGRGVGAD